MIITTGKFLNETIESLDLQGDERTKTVENARRIVEKVVESYNDIIAEGHVGTNGTGIPSSFSARGIGPIGLVYGRIQSGKTRAMIVSTAMAFDNGFRISVVLTSNINDLVNQTHSDFTTDLKGVAVYTKDDELTDQVDDARLEMQHHNGRILIIASKGSTSLKNITAFLNSIEARNYPVLIFDDEGDQASLDTNTYKRSTTGNLTLQPSTINKLIRKLRNDFRASVYVAVTGTPQGVLLQSASSDNRPMFVVMLPHGDGYVGGDFFFESQEPDDTDEKLVAIIPADDKASLINTKRPFPVGLKDAILYFLLSASAAARMLGWPPTRGYQFLCHPSLKNNEQGHAAKRIQMFLTEVKRALMGQDDTLMILDSMNRLYDQLKSRTGSSTPSLSDLKEIVRQELLRKKVLVINAQNTRRRGIEYGPGFNFLIGGNTLGRGIAIPNLLVTYYVRTAKVSQIDTMHQHARMFGYRTRTLPFTRLFIPKTLYYRFRDIHHSDQGLRDFITNHIDTYPDSFPIEFSNGLRPTRKSVLDVNNTDVVWPGMQIFPTNMHLPQRAYRAVLQLVATEFGVTPSDLKSLEKKGQAGVVIPVERAIEIVQHIKTKSQSSWHDKTIGTVLEKLAQKLGTEVRLKFRTANRTIEENGGLNSGTLEGKIQAADRKEDIPTLWMMAVTGKEGSESGAGETFMFPTIVVPSKLPKVFVFSKK